MEVSVPRVEGLRSAEAVRRIEDRGLVAEYDYIGTPSCAGLPAGSRIAVQRPWPLALVKPEVTVRIQPGCRPGDRLPACGAEDVHVRAYGGEGGWKGGGNYASADLRNVSGRPCLMDATLELAILSSGSLVPIEGNPATAEVRKRLGIGGGLTLQAEWWNWCGPHGRFSVRARLLGVADEGRTPRAPCVGRQRGYLAFRAIVPGAGRHAYRAALRSVGAR